MNKEAKKILAEALERICREHNIRVTSADVVWQYFSTYTPEQRWVVHGIEVRGSLEDRDGSRS